MKSITALAVMIVLLPGSSPAGACDCIRPQPLSAAVRKEAPFIFEGKVVEIVERSLHTVRSTSGGGSSEVKPMGREVVFDVTRAWNGVTTKRLAVAAEFSDCMFPFTIDHPYVVFAGKHAKGGPATSICTRTMESAQGRGRDRPARAGDHAEVAIIRAGEMAEWSMAVVLKTTALHRNTPIEWAISSLCPADCPRNCPLL